MLSLAMEASERKQAEEALRESEEKYRTLFETALDGVVVIDAETMKMVLANKAAAEIGGFDSVEGMLETNFLDFIAPEERERVIRIMAEDMFEKDLRQVNEFRAIKKNGEKIWVSAIGVRTEYQGRLAGLCSFRNVTERKQAEERLQQSEENLKAYLESAPDGIYINDLKGTFLYGNKKAEEIMGYKREELIGKSFLHLKILPGKHLAKAGKLLVLNVMGKPTGPDEFEMIRKNGSHVWVEINTTPVKQQEGTVVIGFVRDITKRKQAEEALRESEERYRSIVNLSGEVGEAVIMLQDTEQGEATHIFVSDQWPRITGYSRKELLGMSFFDLVLPQNRQASLERHRRKMSGESIPELFEMSIIRKDGTEVPIEVTSAYTTYQGERANVVFVRDITKRKGAEEREKKLQQELDLASRLATVGEMSSGIAHEINNPLTGVIGFSDLLLKKDLPEDIREYVNIIYEGSQRVASITNRMLTFARQRKPERTSVEINEIIETTLAMRTYEMESSNIKITTQLASDIPLTFADASQLQQVFLNIILNAEMEMKLAHGGGNLTVKTKRIDNTIQVSFGDDGPGILKKNLERLFNPFFTTREPGKGTGLGLSICYSIVTQHGGKIYARSRLGKGATFFVELPIVTKEEQLEMAEPAAEVSKTLSRARILVVDDDTIVQEFLTKVLGEEGHEVAIVANGEDALERLGSEDYDVILLDIKLPGMSGIELYKYMQKAVKSLARRVVFITGDVMNKDTMDFLSRTRAPYITKPFDGEQIKNDVDHILAERA
jgi:PAS domain S-box-containing protein